MLSYLKTLVLLGAFLNIGSGHAAPARPKAIPLECFSEMPDSIQYSDLKAWIERCEIKTIPELIQHLPTSFKDQYTLVYQSQAESEVKHPGTVDPLHPRAILFGGNGSLVLSFTGKPGTPSFQEIQLFQYQKDLGEFAFKTIQFSSGAPEFNEHPSSCIQCHESPEKPIWAAYAKWPGVYGSKDDILITGSPEFKDYEKFLERIRTADSEVGDIRYSLLKNLNLRYQVGDQPLQSLNLARRPNFALTLSLSILQADALAERYVNTSYFRQHRALQEWQLTGCQETTYAIPNQNLDQLTRHYRLDAHSRELFPNSGDQTLDFKLLDTFNTGITRSIPGMALDRVLSKSRASFVGFKLATIDGYDPQTLPRIFKSLFITNPPDVSICAAIRKDLILELVALERELPFKTAESPEVRALHSGSAKNPFSSCIECHSGSDAYASAIPFENLVELKALLNRNPLLGTKILESIRSGKMPKNRPDVNQNNILPSIEEFILRND